MTSTHSKRAEAFQAMLALRPERAAGILARHPDSLRLAEPAESAKLEDLLVADLVAPESRSAPAEAYRHITRLEYFLRSRVSAPRRAAHRRGAGMPAPFDLILACDEEEEVRVRLECGLVIFAQIALITSPELRVELLKPLGTRLARGVANRLEREMARSLLIGLPRPYIRAFMDLRRRLVATHDREELVSALGAALIQHAASDLDESLRSRLTAAAEPIQEKQVPPEPSPALSRKLLIGVMELFK